MIAKKQNQRGITLIALVITIIVLLILVGVTISMMLKDDGIIGQAQNAKKAQEKAIVEENEKIAVGEGNVDIHTEGTVANKVKVGDYVKYTYEVEDKPKVYTAQNEITGKSTNNTDEAFNSSENAKVTNWRVLSKKDGIVKLVAETPVAGLTLNKANGYLNGPTVLNQICKTLYSGVNGTARSICIEDVNEIIEYAGKRLYNDDNDEYIEIPNDVKTISDLEETIDMNLENRKTPDGKEIGTYPVNYYYEELENGLLTSDNTYWLASSCVYADFFNSCVNFNMFYISNESLLDAEMIFDSYEEGGTYYGHQYAIRPVVILKSGLKIDGGTGTSENEWTIKN